MRFHLKNSITGFLSSGEERSVVVKKNILGSFINKGASVIISLLLVPLTLGYVSSELYGIWLTISSIVGWITILDIGFSLGLKNKLAEAIALEQWDYGRELVSTTYFMMLLIFIPVGIILEFVVPLINWPSLLHVSDVYNQEIIRTLTVVVAYFCIYMVISVFTSVIAAFQKTAFSGTLGVIGQLLALITILILTKLVPPSLLALAFAYTIMPLIVLLIASIVLYKGRFKKVAPRFSAIRKKHIGTLFGLGYKFFIIMLQTVIMFQTTNILISNISGPEDVTSYNIAYKYLTVAMMVFNIVMTPLWPAFTDAYTKKDFKWMRSIYSKMTSLVYITIAIIILMLFVSPFVYKIWIGDKASIPFQMTLIVAIYVAINCWDTLQVNMINGIGCVQLQMYVTLIGLVCQIPLAFILGKIIGAPGVVLSQSIIVFIYCLFFTTQLRRILNGTATGVWAK